jgi:hypothetical protein
MRTDGWTGRHDEANSRFSKCCKKKNGLYSQNVSSISTNISRYTDVTGCPQAAITWRLVPEMTALKVTQRAPSHVQRSEDSATHKAGYRGGRPSREIAAACDLVTSDKARRLRAVQSEEKPSS